MKRILKEPLVHFLLLGALIFGSYILTNPNTQVGKNVIVISPGRIEQLAAIFEKTWQRPASAEEMVGLINDAVLEEVYFRKAVEMGIDQNDTMIRRRLRQKLEFLTDDSVALAEPPEEELERYLSDHADDFRTDPTYRFRQIYFNPDKHGADPLTEIQAKADALRTGENVPGDTSLLPEAFEAASSRIIDATFGSGFAGKLEGLTLGEWSDPIPSGYGLHLVRIDAVTPGDLPSLESIRPEVEREWSNVRRLEARAAFNRALLKDFQIVIEWPDTGSDPDSSR